MKQCFLAHEAVKVYLFIYRRVFPYLLIENTIISTMKNREGKTELESFKMNFRIFVTYISESIIAL